METGRRDHFFVAGTAGTLEAALDGEGDASTVLALGFLVCDFTKTFAFSFDLACFSGP
jgi:hypothetical protein